MLNRLFLTRSAFDTVFKTARYALVFLGLCQIACVKTGDIVSSSQREELKAVVNGHNLSRTAPKQSSEYPTKDIERGWLVSLATVTNHAVLTHQDKTRLLLRCVDGTELESKVSSEDWFEIEGDGIYLLIHEICEASQFKLVFPDSSTDWIDLPVSSEQDGVPQK